MEGLYPLIPSELLKDKATFKAILSWTHPAFMDMVTGIGFNANTIPQEVFAKIEAATLSDGKLELEYQVDLAKLPKVRCGKALEHQEDASKVGPSCAAVYLKAFTGPLGVYKKIASSYLADNKDPDCKLAEFLTKSLELFKNLGLSDDDAISCIYPGTTSRDCLTRWSEHDSDSSTSLNALFFRVFEKTVQFPVMCVVRGNIAMSLAFESFIASLLQLSTLLTLRKSDPYASYLLQAHDGSALTRINAGAFLHEQDVLGFVTQFCGPRDTLLSEIHLPKNVTLCLQNNVGRILDYCSGKRFVAKFGNIISTPADVKEKLTVEHFHSYVSSFGRARRVANIAKKEKISLEAASSEVGRRWRAGMVANIAKKEKISLEAASSKLSSRGRTGAVASIAKKEKISLEAASSELGRRANAVAVANIAKKENISLEAASSLMSRRGGEGRKAKEDKLRNRTRDTKLCCFKCYKNEGVTHVQLFPVKKSPIGEGILKGHPKVAHYSKCSNCKKKHWKWADPNKLDTVIERCCIRDNCFNTKKKPHDLCHKHLGYY